MGQCLDVWQPDIHDETKEPRPAGHEIPLDDATAGGFAVEDSAHHRAECSVETEAQATDKGADIEAGDDEEQQLWSLEWELLSVHSKGLLEVLLAGLDFLAHMMRHNPGEALIPGSQALSSPWHAADPDLARAISRMGVCGLIQRSLVMFGTDADGPEVVHILVQQHRWVFVCLSIA